MFRSVFYRVLLAVPTMLGVAIICFLLVQIAPGDPLVSVMPPDASEALRRSLMQAYGFDKPLPVQFVHWLWRALLASLMARAEMVRALMLEFLTINVGVVYDVAPIN